IPCRTFGAALPNTTPGGQVTALDSGLYDNADINVTFTVVITAAPGVHAETQTINVNAAATDRVVIRNLNISKLPFFEGGAGNGIGVTRVGSISIENCVINGFGTGIDFNLTGAANAAISNTTVRYSISRGIAFFTTAGLIKASIDHSRIELGGFSGPVADGITVLGHGRVTVRETTASGNNGAGFVATGGELILDNCESSDNGDGVIAASNSSANGLVIASKTTATHNTRNGFRQEGTGTFNSTGDNIVRRNGSANTFGTIGSVSGT
ncbi:MAG: right-handed parallel beta-helix repeat-containing protein, partial [Acidobacteriota bacterium]